jgi:acyl carrier protein
MERHPALVAAQYLSAASATSRVGANQKGCFSLAGALFEAARARLQCMTVPAQQSAILEVVTKEIIDLVKVEVTDVDLAAESILQDAGLDSLKFMSVVFKIEAHYDIELQEEDADELRTVSDLANLVVGRIQERS